MWEASGTHTNIALLPNTSSPVSISTVNALHNTYYINNDYASATKATELNGLTKLIKTADYYVTAGTTYHVKLAIADGQDAGIDSIVWIRVGSVRFNIKDCVGAWVPHMWGPLNGTCTGACEGGDGLLPEVYFISVAAANGERKHAITFNECDMHAAAFAISSEVAVTSHDLWQPPAANASATACHRASKSFQTYAIGRARCIAACNPGICFAANLPTDTCLLLDRRK